MKTSLRLITLISIILWTLSLTGCENYAERTHESWVTPQPAPVYDDSTIFARITQAIQTDPDLRGVNIDIKVRDGNVTLSGNVGSENQITKINMHAWIVDGVKKVDNAVTVQ